MTSPPTNGVARKLASNGHNINNNNNNARQYLDVGPLSRTLKTSAGTNANSLSHGGPRNSTTAGATADGRVNGLVSESEAIGDRRAAVFVRNNNNTSYNSRVLFHLGSRDDDAFDVITNDVVASI